MHRTVIVDVSMSCDFHWQAGFRVAKPAQRLPAVDLGAVCEIVLLVPIGVDLRFVPDILDSDGRVRHPNDLLLSGQEGVDVVERRGGRRDPVYRELENPWVVEHRERAEGLRVHVVALAGTLGGERGGSGAVDVSVRVARSLSAGRRLTLGRTLSSASVNRHPAQ